MNNNEFNKKKELAKLKEKWETLGDLITIKIDQSGEAKFSMPDDFESYIESLLNSDE
jgi:hypothetical protein